MQSQPKSSGFEVGLCFSNQPMKGKNAIFQQSKLLEYYDFYFLFLNILFSKDTWIYIKTHMCSALESIPCLDPVRSLLGPVLGVYFVFLVAALCLVQSNSSVLSCVNIHTLSSSKLQWNLSRYKIQQRVKL